MLYGRDYEGRTKVFRGKRSYGVPQDPSYIILRRTRSIEEEELGFGSIDGGAWGFRKKIKKFKEDRGLMNRRMAKENCVINKLLVREGKKSMERNALLRVRGDGKLKETTETFSHKHKEKQRERVTLANAEGGMESRGGGTI